MTRGAAASPPAPTTSGRRREQHGGIVDLLGPAARDDVGGFTGDIVDEWGRHSFPASDPPANW